MFRFAVLGLVVAGCYAPAAPEGAPCTNDDQCPTGQRCFSESCSSHGAAVPDDAAIDAPPDGPPDAPPDAALACTTKGLTCQTAFAFQCGTSCWVGCPIAKPRAEAANLCRSWGGDLGAIDSATEQTCVQAKLGLVPVWIGLTQAPAQTKPDTGWTWNATTPLAFEHWQPTVPDDDDGNENGSEQCGKIQVDGTWDDQSCQVANAFFCER